MVLQHSTHDYLACLAIHRDGVYRRRLKNLHKGRDTVGVRMNTVVEESWKARRALKWRVPNEISVSE